MAESAAAMATPATELPESDTAPEPEPLPEPPVLLLPPPVLDGPGAGAVVVTSLGTVSFSAVRLTGAGAFATVRFVLRFAASQTGPPPAPTAVVFGATNGT